MLTGTVSRTLFTGGAVLARPLGAGVVVIRQGSGVVLVTYGAVGDMVGLRWLLCSWCVRDRVVGQCCSVCVGDSAAALWCAAPYRGVQNERACWFFWKRLLRGALASGYCGFRPFRATRHVLFERGLVSYYCCWMPTRDTPQQQQVLCGGLVRCSLGWCATSLLQISNMDMGTFSANQWFCRARQRCACLCAVCRMQ
jgi:hypothetical protein